MIVEKAAQAGSRYGVLPLPAYGAKITLPDRDDVKHHFLHHFRAHNDDCHGRVRRRWGLKLTSQWEAHNMVMQDYDSPLDSLHADTERDILTDDNWCLRQQDNENALRTSRRAAVVGHAKVMTYDDIVEAEKKRDSKRKKRV